MARRNTRLPQDSEREREIDLPVSVAKLLVESIGDRKTGLLFCTRHGNQLNQRNILRHLHKALEEVGFEKAREHSFRRFRNTYLRNFTACPESILDFWLGWGSEGMSRHYDKIKSDVVFRKEVTNSCGVGFDVLGSIAPIESKLESHAVAVNA
jgi:integrase